MTIWDDGYSGVYVILCVYYADEIRDSDGIFKLTVIQLIFPFKISCICFSSEIPLLSLDEICKCSYVWRLTLILYIRYTRVSDSLVGVVEIHDVVHWLPCEAEVDHPVH